MRSLILLLLLSFSAPALAIYKCEFAGKLMYSDLPCRQGQIKELNVVPPSPDSDDAQQRLQQDKKNLEKLEKQRHRQESIDEKKQKRELKARQVHEKKCAELAQRRQWAEEDLASASFRSRDKTQRNVRRAEEKYKLVCQD